MSDLEFIVSSLKQRFIPGRISKSKKAVPVTIEPEPALSLRHYLKASTCSGCRHKCSLDAPECEKGMFQAELAQKKFQQ